MKTLTALLITSLFVACKPETTSETTKPDTPTYRTEVPPEVLAREEAEHLAWCESIYHRNVGCPKHGQVEIPPEVLARQEAAHLAWCESINHRNGSCPGFRD